MKNPPLGARLRTISNMIPAGARLLDVGTDHAYIPIYHALVGDLKSIIASDINSGPLGRARIAAEQYGVEDMIDLRLTPGLDGIQPWETDTVVIAGMGGETIISIIKDVDWLCSRDKLLILQPQSKISELRCYLAENGYRIEREELVSEGNKFYFCFAVRAGAMEIPDELHAALGCAADGRDELSRSYLREERIRCAAILRAVSNSDSNNADDRIDLCRRIVRHINSVLGEELGE